LCGRQLPRDSYLHVSRVTAALLRSRVEDGFAGRFLLGKPKEHIFQRDRDQLEFKEAPSTRDHKACQIVSQVASEFRFDEKCVRVVLLDRQSPGQRSEEHTSEL